MATYNADAIQAAIDRDPAIGPAEAKAIHALLRDGPAPFIIFADGPEVAAPEVEVEQAVHTCGGPVFGRLSPSGCPRCDELRAGAAPRGWGRSSRFDGYATEPHSCQERNCGPICTWGDW